MNYKHIKQEEIDKIVKSHERWLKNGKGKRADFTDCNLSYKNFSYKDLSGAIFNNTFLYKTHFYKSILSEASFFNAYISEISTLNNAKIDRIIGKVICSVSGVQGECGNQIILLAEGKKNDWIFFCGCFKGNLDLLLKWLKKHRLKNSFEMKSTMSCIELLMSLAEMKIEQQNTIIHDKNKLENKK